MRIWTYANVLGTAGTWMQLVAQNVLVFQLTGSPAAAGLSVAAQAAPTLLLGVRGGALVDRLPLRVTALAGQVILSGLAFGTAGLAMLDLLSVPVLVALGAVGGLVATVEAPACVLLGNDLVDREDVPSAIAVGSVVGNVGRLLGTAAAGLVIAAVGVPGAYAINGLSFLVVAAAIPFLRPAPVGLDVPVVPLADVPDAHDRPADRPLRFLAAHPVLLGLAAVTMVSALLGRNYSMSLAALVTGPMGLGAGAYGRVALALSIGGICGAMLSGSMRRPSLRTVVLLCVVGGGLQAFAAMSPGLSTLMVVAALLSAAESAAGTMTSSLVQTVPPAHLRGRAVGAWRSVSTGWGLAGPPALGLLLQLGGVRVGLATGGLLTVLVLGGAQFAVQSRRSGVRRLLTDSSARIPAP
jgi:MFS family permease